MRHLMSALLLTIPAALAMADSNQPIAIDVIQGHKISLIEVRNVHISGLVAGLPNNEQSDEIEAGSTFTMADNCVASDLSKSSWRELVPAQKDAPAKLDSPVQGCSHISSIFLSPQAGNTATITIEANYRSSEETRQNNDNGDTSVFDRVMGQITLPALCTVISTFDNPSILGFLAYELRDGREVLPSGQYVECKLRGSGTGTILFSVLDYRRP